MKSKNEVTRKCVSCGRILEKKLLTRVVRDRNGKVSLDLTGHKEGRGAYICGRECLLKACKRNSLERSFRAAVSEDDKEGLKLGFPEQ